MACGSGKTIQLAKNAQLQTDREGFKRVFWSPTMPFDGPAIYVRALILNNSNATIRFVGRFSVDEVTWAAVDTTGGYLDTQTAGYETVGALSFQYLGDASVRGPFFQIGIEVDSDNGTAEGLITLSADATFGSIRPERVDLAATTSPLAVTTVPTQIPGAGRVSTYGCRQVRIEVQFAAAVAQTLSLYLATSNTSTDTLVVDHQAKISTTNTGLLTFCFVVDSPDAWSTVFYEAGGTTAAVSRVYIVRIP